MAMLAALLLSACTKPTETNVASNQPALAENVATPLNPPAPGTPGGLPDDRTPLEEPKGPIDPKSAEAAGQVAQHYAALIEQGRWNEASDYWRDAAAAIRFRRDIADYSEVHMEIGKPGQSEGAAGSIYIIVPAVFYGKRKSGADFREPGLVSLRRVNDVPGSTEAQRHWHIDEIKLVRMG